jgi:hypothetical protein
MRKQYITLGLALLGFVVFSCAPSEPSTPAPSTSEILEALETEVNEQDLEGVMALFAENAVWEESYKNQTYEGSENIAWGWEVYFMTPVTSEFRNISVDGDTATFTWVEFRPAMNKLWPTIIEVQHGKITHIEWPEDAVRESAELE